MPVGNPTPLRLPSEESRYIAGLIKTLTDKVNEIDRRVAEELGAFAAELSRNTRAIQDLRERGDGMRKELGSVPDLAVHAAEQRIDELRQELRDRDLAVARAENVALKAEADRQNLAHEQAAIADEARKKRNRDEWIRGIVLILVTACTAIAATHAAWH